MLGELVRVSFAAGELVIRESEPAGPLYVVEEGRLRASTDVGGDRRVLAYYGTGDVFGERSLLTNGPRAASVEAVSDCKLLALPTTAFQSLVEGWPEFRQQIEAWSPSTTTSASLTFRRM